MQAAPLCASVTTDSESSSASKLHVANLIKWNWLRMATDYSTKNDNQRCSEGEGDGADEETALEVGDRTEEKRGDGGGNVDAERLEP